MSNLLTFGRGRDSPFYFPLKKCWFGLVGLWCLTPLSTTFQLYRDSVLLVEKTGVPGENHRTTCRKSLTNFIT